MERHSRRRQLSLAERRGRRAAALVALAASAGLGILCARARLAPRAPEGLPAVVDEAEGLVGPVPDAGSGASTAQKLLETSEPSRRVGSSDVAQEASAVLDSYEQRGDCALARAMYLGLSGQAWGCVVYGGDWAEVCIVQGGDGEGSEVSVWRLTEEEVLEALGP